MMSRALPLRALLSIRHPESRVFPPEFVWRAPPPVGAPVPSPSGEADPPVGDPSRIYPAQLAAGCADKRRWEDSPCSL
eukprot:852942-Rhodomonas_salina.1